MTDIVSSFALSLHFTSPPPVEYTDIPDSREHPGYTVCRIGEMHQRVDVYLPLGHRLIAGESDAHG